MAVPVRNFITATGDARIDSLLSGRGWDTGATRVITYSLHTHLYGFRGAISPEQAARIDAAFEA